MSRVYKIDIQYEKVSEEKLCDVCGGFLPDVDEQEIKELSTTHGIQADKCSGYKCWI